MCNSGHVLEKPMLASVTLYNLSHKNNPSVQLTTLSVLGYHQHSRFNINLSEEELNWKADWDGEAAADPGVFFTFFYTYERIRDS